jgi:hypothetical protein
MSEEKFCCGTVEHVLENGRVMEYDETIRSFSIDSMDDYRHRYGLFYCPWCGTKFPKELSNEWMDTVRDELGLEDPADDDRDKVTEEFRTDEWWKKRGL